MEEAINAYSPEEGEELVKAARLAVATYVSSAKFSRWIVEDKLGKFRQKHGLFVTLEHYPTRTLRGCIGYPIAAKQVKDTVIDAAIAAATSDPRFRPVSHMELDHLVVEVSVLSHPEPISADAPEGIIRQVRVGRDGLMIRHGFNSGILLPIVAAEQGWDSEEFLENVAAKAGLDEGRWKSPGVSLHKFTAQVFRERSPGGTIEELHLRQ